MRWRRRQWFVGCSTQPAPRELGQRVAAPQLQGVVEGRHPIRQVRLVDGRHDPLLELDGVDVVGHHQLVATRSGGERRPSGRHPELLAELGDIGAHRAGGARIRGRAPEGVDDGLDGRGPPGAQHQEGQQGAAFGPTEVEQTLRPVRLEGAEHPKAHPHVPHGPTGYDPHEKESTRYRP
jgi:hypothetical protein